MSPPVLTSLSISSPYFWLCPLLFAALGFCLSYGGLLWLFGKGYPNLERFVLAQILGKQNTAARERLCRYCDETLPEKLEAWSLTYFKSLDQPHRQQIVDGMSSLYDRLFPLFRLEYHQAEVMMDVVFSTFLTPETIRTMAVEALAGVPTYEIEAAVKQSLSGWSGLLGRFVDLKPIIERLKQDLLRRPELGTALIIKAIDRMEVREKLAEGLSKLDWQKLNVQEQQGIRSWLNRFVSEWLQDDPRTLAALVASALGGVCRILPGIVLNTDLKPFEAVASQHQCVRQATCMVLVKPLLIQVAYGLSAFAFLLGLLASSLSPLIANGFGP